MKNFISFLFLTILTFSCYGEFFDISEKAFPFQIHDLKKDSLVSAYFLNSPIDESKRITVQDGHLYSDQKRIRIFGTNLSDIPTKDLAPYYAELIASQGYNCIRFHHLDSSWANGFLKLNENNKYILNQEKLDDFDFFFNELKKNGIYSNINLLTGRTFNSSDGLPKSIDIISGWKAKHCYGFWNDQAKDIQKDYAKQLLTHVNPYTGLSYTEDPAVAIVEINNENGMLHAYKNNLLKDYDDVLWSDLESKWNQWLSKKNLSYKKLSDKYNITAKEGKNLITDKSKWSLEQYDGAKVNLTQNNNEFKLSIIDNGNKDWHVQYSYTNLNLTSDKIYTISFSAKASKKSIISLSLMQAHDPWKNAGISESLQLSTSWKPFSITTSDILSDNNLRITFGSMGFLKGTTIYLKDVTIKEGGNFCPLKEGINSTSENPQLAFPRYDVYKTLPEDYKNLVMEFLYDIEDSYWSEMNEFLKKDLCGKFLTMGTSIGCSTLNLMNQFDIIDAHAYWNHPVFPIRDWNQNDYFIENKSLIAESTGGTLTNLAKTRVYGKPFSVSEYDHPYPNQFSPEMYTMISAYACFQDWDCIYTFCSTLPDLSPKSKEHIKGYFDQTGNPAKACAAPFAARIFRLNLIQPGEEKYYLKITKNNELENLKKFTAWSIGDTEIFGMKKELGFNHQIGVILEDNTPANGIEITENKYIVNDYTDTNEIFWNPKQGVFAINSPNVKSLITAKNASLPEFDKNWIENAKNIFFIPEKKDFQVFTAIRENNDYLIYACNWAGNKNENLMNYADKNKNRGYKATRDAISISNKPSYDNLCSIAMSSEGLLTSDLSNKKLYKLSSNGNQDSEVSEKNIFSCKNKTIWYFFK